MALVSERYRIAAAFGSPEISDTKPGDTVKISTEFPSVKTAKGTRSGVILFKVEDLHPSADNNHESFAMNVTWDDLSGIRNKDVRTLKFASLSTPTPAPVAATPVAETSVTQTPGTETAEAASPVLQTPTHVTGKRATSIMLFLCMVVMTLPL